MFAAGNGAACSAFKEAIVYNFLQRGGSVSVRSARNTGAARREPEATSVSSRTRANFSVFPGTYSAHVGVASDTIVADDCIGSRACVASNGK